MLDPTVWEPEAHEPPVIGARRKMHGVTVLKCSLPIDHDQYSREANHGPHRGALVWCPGHAMQPWVCPTAPESENLGRDHSHGAHAWQRDDSEIWVWCRGYIDVSVRPDHVEAVPRPVWSKWDPADLEAGWFEPRDGWAGIDTIGRRP